MARLVWAAWALAIVSVGGLSAGEVWGEEIATVQPAIDISPASVWVARRSWHIDLGFAVSELRGPLRAIAGNFPQARYIFFGFGDRRYLTAKRHGLGNLAAAVWPGDGLMLLTAINGAPAQAFGAQHVLALPLQADEMAALQRFVWESFESENQSAESIAQGPYEGSLYFAARPRYSGLHTCNSWAAEGLAAAGLPIRHRLIVLAGQLWSQLRRLQRQPAHAEPSLAGATL